MTYCFAAMYTSAQVANKSITARTNNCTGHPFFINTCLSCCLKYIEINFTSD